ncbi:MAG: coiled coil domain-containing protein, partial [Nitrosomonadaceae bacterium]|nr:coiled coil domain-containing protein [Nitrosomonadaceae bacterium]
VDQTEEQVQAEFRKQIEALHSKREEAHKKLHEVEQASESAWGDMKMGIEMALDDISEAINSAISRFK